MTDRKDHRGNRVYGDAVSSRETPEQRGARIGREAAERRNQGGDPMSTRTCQHEVDTMPGVYTNQNHYRPCGRKAVGSVELAYSTEQVCKMHANYWTRRGFAVARYEETR